MLLRLSRFVHLLPVGDDRVLVVDAISHVRFVVTLDFARQIASFATPRDVAPGGTVTELMERGILTDKSPDAELAHVAEVLRPYHGRDPGQMLEQYRRAKKEGASPYWAVNAALTAADLDRSKPRIELVLFGDCDVHMESDFMRREAAARGLDLRVAATFPDDLRFAGEHNHDIIIVGALRSRMTVVETPLPGQSPSNQPPHAAFIAEAKRIIDGLRQITQAPILFDNLPEPTVQPLGLAERGAMGHRNRFRAANLALADLAETYTDVHVTDIAAALNTVGGERLLDDGEVGFTHFGSPGWMLQRSEDEKRAVHGIFPPLDPLADRLNGNPYEREEVAARAHIDGVVTTLAIGRKKCVILDLDGVLWPGVLAETGRPFAWNPNVSPTFSYIGLFFGLHEALLCLKKRGILLACVSKNDEAVVRSLWKYEDHYPRDTLLTPDDFVTWRVNWNDKVENIRSIADELGFAPETFLFIDDHPVERERVRQRLPEVEVWGEDPFILRRRLLKDPRLQLPRVTAESAARTALTKAQLGRQAARAAADSASVSENDFVATLNVQTRVEHLSPGSTLGADLERVVELFQRTTQFNTTGAKFSAAELEVLLRTPQARVYVVHVTDRFGDHGLVGSAVIKDGEILGLVLSCRVLGMGVEHAFLRHVIADVIADVIAGAGTTPLAGRIIPTARNTPVRNIYSDHGFQSDGTGLWRRTLP